MRSIKISILISTLVLFACPDTKPPKSEGYEQPVPIGQPVTCAVSHKTCSHTESTESAVYRERTFYFCCEGCRARFVAQPQAFAEVPSGDSVSPP